METTDRIDAICRYSDEMVLHLSVHTDSEDLTERHVAVAMVNEKTGAEKSAEFDLEAVGELHGVEFDAGLFCVFALDKFNNCLTGYDMSEDGFYIKIHDQVNDYYFEYSTTLEEV